MAVAYDVRCPEHGVRETIHPISMAGEFPCPECGEVCPQVISVLAGIRVEDSDGIGSERGDETSGTYITLPEIPVPIGRDSTGRMRYDHRSPTTADIPNRHAFLEAAKRAGLSPGDGGRYRTVGQR